MTTSDLSPARLDTRIDRARPWRRTPSASRGAHRAATLVQMDRRGRRGAKGRVETPVADGATAEETAAIARPTGGALTRWKRELRKLFPRRCTSTSGLGAPSPVQTGAMPMPGGSVQAMAAKTRCGPRRHFSRHHRAVAMRRTRVCPPAGSAPVSAIEPSRPPVRGRIRSIHNRIRRSNTPPRMRTNRSRSDRVHVPDPAVRSIGAGCRRRHT